MIDSRTNTQLDQLWASATDTEILPAGEYVAHASSGRIRTCKTGTQSYTIEFTILEGEHRDKRVWLDNYLTDRAMARTKRMLAKLGITSPAQLQQPLPYGLRCKVRVGVRKDDQDTTRNQVEDFTYLGQDEAPSFVITPNPASDLFA